MRAWPSKKKWHKMPAFFSFFHTSTRRIGWKGRKRLQLLSQHNFRTPHQNEAWNSSYQRITSYFSVDTKSRQCIEGAKKCQRHQITRFSDVEKKSENRRSPYGTTSTCSSLKPRVTIQNLCCFGGVYPPACARNSRGIDGPRSPSSFIPV